VDGGGGGGAPDPQGARARRREPGIMVSIMTFGIKTNNTCAIVVLELI
jgi:hypothetical protein